MGSLNPQTTAAFAFNSLIINVYRINSVKGSEFIYFVRGKVIPPLCLCFTAAIYNLFKKSKEISGVFIQENTIKHIWFFYDIEKCKAEMSVFIVKQSQ